MTTMTTTMMMNDDDDDDAQFAAQLYAKDGGYRCRQAASRGDGGGDGRFVSYERYNQVSA